MRTSMTFLGALLLASGLATAQDLNQPPAPIAQPATPSAGTNPWVGSFDLGYRGTATTGDFARYDRYGDLRDGAASRFLFKGTSEKYLFSASMDNAGYRDQSYRVNYASGGIKGLFTFDSTPLNYSYMAQTPWAQTSPGVFSLDSSARMLVQTKQALGIASNAAQLASGPSIYRGIASSFDLQQKRETAGFGLGVDAGALGAQFTLQTMKKTGSMPWAASFAFNNANELPLPLDNRTTDYGANLEWANQKGMVRLGWNGSWFDNNIQTLVWDNPLRATDTTPYDPSGYSNGNGPAQGRMALAPSNTLNTISTTGLYKMPRRSTLNGTFAFTTMKQNQSLIPWTINPVIANAGVYASFPGLQSLPRATAEADVRGINGLINFTTRPNNFFGLNARYRYNKHENRTPEFDAIEYVRFDAVPEETGGITEPYNIDRNTFDVNATFHLARYTSVRVGYGYDEYSRTGRAFEKMTDNALRASVDTFSNQYFTIRGIYEHVYRRGNGFDAEMITGSGSQPALRFYDEAERDRDRGTLVVVLTPVQMLSITGSFAGGKDDYNSPDQKFGLLNNDNTSVTVGFDVNPIEKVSLGLNYGRDTYKSLQRSRNASPDATFTNPAFDWTLNNNERVNNFDAYFDVRHAIPKTDLSLTYNYSDSDNAFLHGGPRIDTLMSLGQFQALPDVTNKWRRVTAEARYFFVQKVGIGAGWWYEKFDISDFATVDLPGQPGTPRIDYLGEINTGYGNRPYKGNTGFVRLLVQF
jgi:MtrB/PioB family decaheme-associated outer membrane protein